MARNNTWGGGNSARGSQGRYSTQGSNNANRYNEGRYNAGRGEGAGYGDDDDFVSYQGYGQNEGSGLSRSGNRYDSNDQYYSRSMSGGNRGFGPQGWDADEGRYGSNRGMRSGGSMGNRYDDQYASGRDDDMDDEDINDEDDTNYYAGTGNYDYDDEDDMEDEDEYYGTSQGSSRRGAFGPGFSGNRNNNNRGSGSSNYGSGYQDRDYGDEGYGEGRSMQGGYRGNQSRRTRE